ncbi:MAG: DUF4276 family protein [Acidobacteria bacterium]|nr:DUF4276 family protein [Acidobacteriota bacterium]
MREFLIGHGYFSVAARLQGHAQLKSHRGGGRAWSGVKKEILRHLSEDEGVVVTTFVDFYGLPPSWPKRLGATGPTQIEAEMAKEIGSGRFLPFVMMHEFEALLFSDSAAFCGSVERVDLEPRFAQIRTGFASPEEINDSPQSAPSKRILQLMPGYQKPFDGVNAARAIGLERMRAECPHFNDWLGRLVALRAQL